MNTANKITIIRVLLTPVFIFFAANIDKPNYDMISMIVFVIISFTDFLDGYIARKHNQVTDFGKFLDPLADKILVCSALVMLTDAGRLSGVATVVIIAREFMVTSIRLLAAGSGKVIAASKSGKIKTVSQMLGIAVLFLESYLTPLYPLPYGLIVTVIMLITTIYSGLEYLIKNIHLIETK